MVFTPTTLPDLNTLDADALKAILLATHERFTAQQDELLAAREQLLSRDHEIEHLKLLIAKLRRMQFGRKSEKVERQIEQLELKLEDLEANRAEPTPLYEIEEEIRGRSPDERREARNRKARPLLESLREWLESSLSKLSRKSDTSAAIHYALARWDAFVRYCDDGRIEIDNSAAERALRAVAVGRRNYLFAGSDRGGERAAVCYSLLGSAKLNGLNPEAYLRDVLERIADHPVNRIEDLLPWNIDLNTAAATR